MSDVEELLERLRDPDTLYSSTAPQLRREAAAQIEADAATIRKMLAAQIDANKLICDLSLEHPGISVSEIARMVGVVLPTVINTLREGSG